eukprot:984388-Pyramimonas_sp.AAC.1
MCWVSTAVLREGSLWHRSVGTVIENHVSDHLSNTVYSEKATPSTPLCYHPGKVSSLTDLHVHPILVTQ